jgi:hypothetical protein
VTTAGTGLSGLTAACAAPAVPAVVEGGGAIVAGVAASAWFKEFTKGIAAELATKTVDAAEWVFTEAWKKWEKPTVETYSKAAKDLKLNWRSSAAYGHIVPGTSLFSVGPAQEWNPAIDRLACVRDTGESVLLEPWAWKAVLAYVKTELDGKKDDAYLNHLQLLMATLMPHANGSSGTSPRGTAKWLNFPARDGEVEIVTFTNDSKPKVTVTATGLFTKSPGTPKMRTFDLT